MTNPKNQTRLSGDHPRNGSPIRLAQLVWRRNAFEQVPIGPHLVRAMERWLVPIRVYDYYQAPKSIREIFIHTPVANKFDANCIAELTPGGARYIVIYNGKRWPPRIWWSLAHEFGHIVLRHAFTDGWHDNPQKEREADMFAAELLLPLGAVQEVKHWPVEQIAQFFGTSLKATRNRLKDLNHRWLHLYTIDNIEEGRTRFAQHARPRMRTYTTVKGESITSVTKAINLQKYLTVQWTDSVQSVRLATCPICSFRNDSAFQHMEIRCGSCGTHLINTCTNEGCLLYEHPLTNAYRCCGRCGHPTSWVQMEFQESATEEVRSESEESELPF